MSPREGSTRLHLARILAYPLKGAGGFDLQKVVPDTLGIPGDRRWMLTRPDGLFISQRTHPRLALIRVEPVGSGSEEMVFRAHGPGMEPILLSAPKGPKAWVEVQVHDDRMQALVCSQEASTSFSGFLEDQCRLVFFSKDVVRPVDPELAPGHGTGFSDGYPLLLASEESLDDLNARLVDPLSIHRFRPNLVVRGGKEWEEDSWRVLETGGLRLELVKPCARCPVTTVNQQSAETGKEPLKTLSEFRKWNGKTFFGQNVVYSGIGIFEVGSTVRIVDRGDARPPLPSESSLAS